MFKEKKLYRSPDKMIGGVCAGIAEFLEIDPTIVRVVYALISLFTAGFGGTIVYIVLLIVMPMRPFPDYQYNEYEQNNHNDNNQQ